MSLYDKIIKNQTCINTARTLRNKRKERNKKKRVKGNYKFIDRKKDNEKLCIILAGYKQFLWEDVFGRIEKYVSQDIENIANLFDVSKEEQNIDLLRKSDYKESSTGTLKYLEKENDEEELYQIKEEGINKSQEK